jgi:hypothetical protein
MGSMFQKIRKFIGGVISSDYDMVINGVSVDGDLNVVNGKCYVNGEEVGGDDRTINVFVKGNATFKDVAGFNELVVNGDVNGSFRGMSGKVTVHGHITGDVETMSGDVKCSSIGGSVETMSGDIKVK